MSDLKELLQNGRINKYFHDLLGRRAKVMSPQRLAHLIEQATAMTGAGVCSDEDHCNFSLVMMHVKPIAEDIVGGKLSQEKLAEISNIVFENRIKRPINNIHNFFKAVHDALKEIKSPMKKMAYPQSYLGVYVYPSYNIAKWMNSVKEIYVMSQKRNIDLKYAFDNVTASWEERERHDFSYWMKFYESNEHEKYKIAQMKYYAPAVTDDQSEGRGYFVPMYDKQELRANMPGISPPAMPNMSGMGGSSQELLAKEEAAARQKEERKNYTSHLRNKILARLTAAEKLLSGDEGRDLAGVELARLLEGLHALKRNLLSLQVSAKTVNDLIIREANRMQYTGLVKGASMMRVIAQDPFAGMPSPGEMPGMPGMPGMESSQPETAPEDSPSAIEMFKKRLLQGLQGAGDIYRDFKKPSKTPAALEAPPAEAPMEAAPPSEDGAVPQAQASDDDSEASIVVVAQAPAPMPEPSSAPPAPAQETATVSTEEVEEREDAQSDAKVEDSFDVALENITVDDVIRRLENLATVFKHREIARELSIVDMMMDKIGIAAYFPNLAEAMQKALEANQYSLTRIEDILNKVRGVAVPKSTIDMTPQKETSPEVEKLQTGLDAVEKQEEEKKERRKVRREQKEMETPEAAKATEELNAPVEVERTAPTPVR